MSRSNGARLFNKKTQFINKTLNVREIMDSVLSCSKSRMWPNAPSQINTTKSNKGWVSLLPPLKKATQLEMFSSYFKCPSDFCKGSH